MKIVKTLSTQDAWNGLFNGNRILYCESSKVKINLWGTSDMTLRVQLLENAMVRGKECAEYRISTIQESHIHEFLEALDWDITSLIHVFKTIQYKADKYQHAGLLITRSTSKAIRVFSPFNLTALKPLEKEPEKWTISHAMRVLMNGQYDTLRCDGVYTDDYADDNERKFDRGEIQFPLAWAKDIIESPSGWRVRREEEGQKLHINCHHFNYNSLIINLDKHQTNVFNIAS